MTLKEALHIDQLYQKRVGGRGRKLNPSMYVAKKAQSKIVQIITTNSAFK